MNKTHFNFHEEEKKKKQKKKNKKKLSVHTVYSFLFIPVSDCLDPGQDLHPVGPDRVQNCLLWLFADDKSHRGQDYPHGLNSV